MRAAPNIDVERYRVRSGTYGSTIQDGNNGMFVLPLRAKLVAFAIVSDGRGWDHVSVSLKRPLGRGKGFKEAGRCPTWEEMCLVKDWFFKPDELAVQYHPRSTDYRNLHPHTLHIWRPNGKVDGMIAVPLPEPDPDFVAPRPGETAEECLERRRDLR